MKCIRESRAVLLINTFYLSFQKCPYVFIGIFILCTMVLNSIPFPSTFLCLKLCQNCAFLFSCLSFHVLCWPPHYSCYLNYGQLIKWVLNSFYTNSKIYMTTQLTKFSLNVYFKYLLVNWALWLSYNIFSSWNNASHYLAGCKINYNNKIIGFDYHPSGIKVNGNMLLVAYNLTIESVSFPFTKT